jgi:hypothetical protein
MKVEGNQEVENIADKAGIASAVLCTVHCLVVPMLFLIKFTWADELANYRLPYWWELLDYLFLLISFFAVYHSASHTASRPIKMSLWIFWAILAISIIFSKHLHALAYVASAGLVSTHFMNIRRMKRAIRLQRAM